MENLTPLTKENASQVSTIISISNPEWGTKKFNHNVQPLTNGEFASTYGVGCNSALLFDNEFEFWAVSSWK